jgi:hypothetical protein
MYRVKGHSNLIKKNGAVINTDRKEYERAIQRKKEKKRIENLEKKVDDLSNSVLSLIEILKDKK